MSLLRRTSTYLVLVPSDRPGPILDRMIARCPVEVNSSAVHPSGMAGLRFRCKSDDNTALNIALEIAGGLPFVLQTGYGVNQREIAQ